MGYGSEIAGAIAAIGFIFYQHGFPEGFIYFSFVSAGYLAISLLMGGQGKYGELLEEIRKLEVTEIEIVRNSQRIFAELGISILVFTGATFFLIYGPEYSLLKYFIVYGMLIAITEMIKRFVTYFTTRLYYSKQQGNLYILSRLASRKFSIQDIQETTIESTVDLLKLHPYLTLFTSNTDFTTSFNKVLRLLLPGETIYLTIQETEQWKAVLEAETKSESTIENEVFVLPFYHKRNIKRLLGKFYFAITVKGVSAYTGVLLLLYYFRTPAWLMVIMAIMYWLFNIYISDRVLKVAMDAKAVTDPKVISAADKIFAKAGIPNVKVYETDSAQYNGLATGMNIGRSMVTLTTATLNLPIDAIEGILAHEAVHVKKRDILYGQLYRVLLMLIVAGGLLLIFKQVSDIEAFAIPLFLLVWLLIILFPVFQSFCSQLMEVRADHLGASFLEGGTLQMADSLAALATSQDEAMQKTATYSMKKEDLKEGRSSLARSPWLLRFMEFQIMDHPPMYWRVNTLRVHGNQWGKEIRRRWWKDRFKESFTK
ncbi:M48 family metalloprotease [Paenibacillus tritici]|uniref:M56 family metallopeptidase n=1 Tax=Paenibacillus tritici TaxID=1873425 RepID=UPI001BA760AA|nr:M56 family metallopeptidase [Paenibacillus tritici]QUL52299.1 M48 family metalloprotease [Paenibacillus tritici]